MVLWAISGPTTEITSKGVIEELLYLVKNCNWSSDDPRIFVSSRLPKSPAMDYVRPEINKVAVKISADEDFFLPTCSTSDGKADVFANIPSGEMQIEHGGVAVVDCGFEMTLPPGYKASVHTSLEGLFVSLVDSKRMKVSVFNASNKYVLQNKQPIAKIWIEPVYFF